jgi:1,4-alpha-glucan branching enzyme
LKRREENPMVVKKATRVKIEKKVMKKIPFDFPSPEAKEVYLVGEFNDWDTHATKMRKDKNGYGKRLSP